jgi:hypothetical protein
VSYADSCGNNGLTRSSNYTFAGPLWRFKVSHVTNCNCQAKALGEGVGSACEYKPACGVVVGGRIVSRV